jgi:hypothetical protein
MVVAMAVAVVVVAVVGSREGRVMHDRRVRCAT